MVLVGIIAGAIVGSSGSHQRSVMPDDFNFSESKQAVEDFYGVPCDSVSNYTIADQYVFECSQTRGNFSYVAQATVSYNESGPDEVHLYQ